ncbi:hypothetical protein LR69_02339 [Geobacillus sp. BCO2]|nr:hypothetical protein LR69_02339 [Geobacillus sp. BCO2]
MYPNAYIEYLVHFHSDRDYFECHEILEEHWKQDGRNKGWLVLIQMAVAFYHYRRGNTSGALRLIRRARALLDEAQEMIRRLGSMTRRSPACSTRRLGGSLAANRTKASNCRFATVPFMSNARPPAPAGSSFGGKPAT